MRTSGSRLRKLVHLPHSNQGKRVGRSFSRLFVHILLFHLVSLTFYSYQLVCGNRFGDSDFATHKGRSARAEAMKKGAAYLNIWMEVIRQMNDAVAFCKVTNFPAAAKAIDSAVAFYAGSKTTEEHNEGILMYALAEVRAHQMKTAGHLDNKDDGDAFVNVEIFKEFKNIQMHVSKNGTMCDAAEASKNKVVTWMQVPLIQGVLHYAYLREKEPPTEAEELERMQAEGAVFAATILPWVHRCSSRSAKIIHENMQMGAKTNFKTVKKTLEEHYSTCLNIQCEHVGGVWNHDESKYKDGATPCGVSVKSANGSRIGSIVGISVGVLLAAWVFLRFRKQLSFGGKNKNKKDIQPMYSDSGNIAAVTEIA